MAKLTSTWISEVFETSWLSNKSGTHLDTKPIWFSIEFCGELNSENTILDSDDIQDIEKALRHQFQDKTIICDEGEQLKTYRSYFKDFSEVRTMPNTSIERFAEWVFHRINALIKTRTRSRVEVLSAKCSGGVKHYSTYSRI